MLAFDASAQRQNGGWFLQYVEDWREYCMLALFAVTTCHVFVKTTEALSGPQEMRRGSK